MQTEAAVNKNIKFTYADYVLYPSNGKKLQLVGGEFFMTPAPKTYHQDVSRNLEFILQNFVVKYNLGKIYYAPTDVFLSDEDVVQPDILFISKQRRHIIKKAYIKGAPDLVVEILSETTKKLDLHVKRTLYAKYGVKEYWIVDPDKKKVEILHLGKRGYERGEIYKRGETLTSSVLTGLRISVSDIFRA